MFEKMVSLYRYVGSPKRLSSGVTQVGWLSWRNWQYLRVVCVVSVCVSVCLPHPTQPPNHQRREVEPCGSHLVAPQFLDDLAAKHHPPLLFHTFFCPGVAAERLHCCVQGPHARSANTGGEGDALLARQFLDLHVACMERVVHVCVCVCAPVCECPPKPG
jgi:hypothetical protein